MEEDGPEPGPSKSNWRSRNSKSMTRANSWRGTDQNHLRNRHHSAINREQSSYQVHNERNRQQRHDGQAARRIPGVPERNDNPTRMPTNRGRGRNMGPRQNDRFRPRFIGFTTLEEIARADTKDVLQKINEKREAFMNLIDAPIDKEDVYVLLIEILSKISQTPFVELKSKLILDVCNSNFISNLRNYLTDLPYVIRKTANNLYWKNQSEFWKNFIIFCGDIVETSPSTAFRKCRALIESIPRICLEELKQNHDFDLSEEYVLKLNEIREKMTAFGDKYQPEGKRMKLEDQAMQPPENFRELSLVPGRDDLLGSQPFLRPNIVEGGYTHVEHYLDVQFRLLREDCFGPFREGINQFLADHKKKKYDHVRIFHDVKFVCPYVDSLKVGALVQIDMRSNKQFKRINWAHNKRFLYGSLVLFTKDHCANFIAATILDRDVNLLSTGKLPVAIIDTDINHDIYNNEEIYTMIESEVYFEPYFHVLKALQDPSFPKHLAMQQYIVKVDPASKHPAYLTADTEFAIRDDESSTCVKGDSSPLYSKTTEDNEEGELFSRTSEDDDEGELFSRTSEDDDEDGLLSKMDAKIKFKVLQPNTWPTKEMLNFNESQMEAFRLALTHEFAVIQGPPGTGKTFIGIHVAKTLLNNIPSNNNCLMLIICYTNHALDQFLEAISKITKSIVRIGSQSRNKAMEQFNLTNLRRASLSAGHSFFIEQKILLREAIQNLQEALMYLDILNNGVISYNMLKNYVPAVILLEEYYKKMHISVYDPLEFWLFENREEYYTNNFEDIISEYEQVTKEDDDTDKKRLEMILDDYKESQEEKSKLESSKREKACFSLFDAKVRIKDLVTIYKASRDFNERYQLQLQIIDLDSRINLYSDMVTYRDREVRLHLSPRTNFSAISMQNRWSLYFMWLTEPMNQAKEEVARLQASVTPLITAYDEARMMMDVQLLKSKRTKVVGMTTSGAARMRKLLQAIAPRIVIVEEAAEVLEQHIITSLTQDCQHLILIGDHQQLRPSASHIKLARQYNMEVSLFERMITNGIHSRRLNVQHRMRPEIAALITPHIYSDLNNHPSVEAFNNVPGIEKNLYFFTHEFREENFNDSNSRANHKEADMTLALANYLMLQGYNSDDITILAAYSGQMFYMRKERQNYATLTKVKITVVDNYQGEESKIILLSLVRNNTDNMIGFLGTDNRICVALSRAKEGFYIFGNMDMLKSKSDLWKKIADTLENNGSLGTTLILKCQNHPEQVTAVSTPEDFNKIPPEGGCFEKCTYQYHCGHKCVLYCHGYDREHINTKCTMKCERILCDLGHVCPLKCREECEPCKVYVLKTLPCGHEMNVYCHREPEDPRNKCLSKIDVTLPSCGHKAQKDCYMDIKDVKCPERCVYRLEACGHVCCRKCHVNSDPHHEKYLCLKPCARAKAGCKAELIGDRGDHQCRKTCNEKCDDCNVQVVKRRSNCKHLERTACCANIEAIPCKKKCARTMSCGHFCKKMCSETCGDCTQLVTKIIPDCNHKVKVECRKDVTREMCTEKCTRKLSCGHPCTGRCGVACDAATCTILTGEVKSPCGHNVKLPCNLLIAHAKGSVAAAQLLAYCAAPCGAELACSHRCAGTCALCRQGRLHQPCKQTCTKDNICGHPCQEPCNKLCPPCKMFCEVKCPHSHCKKLCCVPCVPCQEKCIRTCIHGACTRRCGEPCDRPPCSEKCSKKLSCGHTCRGLCGEPCPNICNICRPEQFPTDFLGDPFEDDDKFILLQDCGHILEVNNMDNLMLGDQENIKIRTCPFCRKPIINTYRYKDTVNNTFKNDINPIKEKVFGTKMQLRAKKQELQTKLQKFVQQFRGSINGYNDMNTAFLIFHNIVKSLFNASMLQMDMAIIYLDVFEMITECWEKFRKLSTTTLMDEFKSQIKMLLDVLKINPKAKIPIKLTEQQQKDISNEIKRLNITVQFSKLVDLSKHLKDENVTQQIETTKAIIFSFCVFNEDKAFESLKALQEMIKSSGIVTKYERALIVKAMNLKAGHWYKCPNGHIYCIGECGGANQESKCPECGALIGGRSHTLAVGNQHAPEMDGSRFPAWSEQNNLANFNVDDIL